MNAFIAFLVDDRDALVKQSIETAIKICEKQEIPIKEQRVRREKKDAWRACRRRRSLG